MMHCCMLDKSRRYPAKLRAVLGAGSHLCLLVLRQRQARAESSAPNLESDRHFQAGSFEP